MKLIVITGSHHRDGTSALMAKEFIQGAKQAGEDWVFDEVKATIKTTIRYLGWNDCGGIFVYGCYQKADIQKINYPRQAFELGKNLERMVLCQ